MRPNLVSTKQVPLIHFIEAHVADLKDNFDGIVSALESPIEEALCEAMLSESLLQLNAVILHGNGDSIYLGGDEPDILRIFIQHGIGKYRVDFFLHHIVLSSGLHKKLIVECDGHDFHEKTKEQARKDKSRDRDLQVVAPVFRFTGSEIWKDAHDCAYQVINYLTS